MGRHGDGRWGLAAAAAILVVVGMGANGCTSADGGGGDGADGTPAPTATGHPSPSAPGSKPGPGSPSASSNVEQDPAHYAAEVRRYAHAADINPQLLMAILYNESYKPHGGEIERSWQSMKPGASFGIGNMHKAAFEETKKGRPFAGRRWEELPDDPALACESAAWYLHDLRSRLPGNRSGKLTEDQLMALGYNTGASNMVTFAQGTKPGPQAQRYLDQLHDNWPKAAKALHT